MQVATKIEHSTGENEDVIIQLFRNGDTESFGWIYDQMAGPLTYFVENIIFSATDAEDIVANAFFKLFKAREGLRSFEHIKRWLYVIVRNESIDYLRTRSRQKETNHEVAYLATGVEENAETERMRATVLQNILQEIEKLPRQRRTILKLYFLEQKSTSEIADLMGLNSQTVLNHKAKALESLRKTGLKSKWLLEGASAFLMVLTHFLLK